MWVIPAMRGVIIKGVLTCEGLWSQTSFLLHSHTILPVMVRPTPLKPEMAAKMLALLRCRRTASGRA